ncbi:hypothetical protein Tcan_10570 [Toxocara canis]|uniref:Uncharacterized protein n=1 Tax=Toxocara canis TaxID=6265 RepID=A0A0B2UXT7_TOXCA|nr:hypothetical protein Tcan_10570 [Toxocara canis]
MHVAMKAQRLVMAQTDKILLKRLMKYNITTLLTGGKNSEEIKPQSSCYIPSSLGHCEGFDVSCYKGFRITVNFSELSLEKDPGQTDQPLKIYQEKIKLVQPPTTGKAE